MQATYTKLKSGQWGIRVAGQATKGQQVTVSTKAGARKIETVSAVVWSGNGVTLCAIAPTSRPASRGGYRKRGDGGPRGDRACYMCGSYYCEGARGGLCEDD